MSTGAPSASATKLLNDAKVTATIKTSSPKPANSELPKSQGFCFLNYEGIPCPISDIDLFSFTDNDLESAEHFLDEASTKLKSIVACRQVTEQVRTGIKTLQTLRTAKLGKIRKPTIRLVSTHGLEHFASSVPLRYKETTEDTDPFDKQIIDVLHSCPFNMCLNLSTWISPTSLRKLAASRNLVHFTQWCLKDSVGLSKIDVPVDAKDKGFSIFGETAIWPAFYEEWLQNKDLFKSTASETQTQENFCESDSISTQIMEGYANVKEENKISIPKYKGKRRRTMENSYTTTRTIETDASQIDGCISGAVWGSSPITLSTSSITAAEGRRGKQRRGTDNNIKYMTEVSAVSSNKLWGSPPMTQNLSAMDMFEMPVSSQSGTPKSTISNNTTRSTNSTAPSSIGRTSHDITSGGSCSNSFEGPIYLPQTSKTSQEHQQQFNVKAWQQQQLADMHVWQQQQQQQYQHQEPPQNHLLDHSPIQHHNFHGVYLSAAPPSMFEYVSLPELQDQLCIPPPHPGVISAISPWVDPSLLYATHFDQRQRQQQTGSSDSGNGMISQG